MALYKISNTGTYYVDNKFGSLDEYTGISNTYSLQYTGAAGVYSTIVGSLTAIGTLPYTIEGWFYTTNTTTIAGQTILDYTGAAPTIQLNTVGVAGNTQLRVVLNGTQVMIGPSIIQQNNWYHFALVRDQLANNVTETQHNLKLYLNGYLENSNADALTYTATASRPIVGQVAAFSAGFVGYLSNLRHLHGMALYTSRHVSNAQPTAVTHSNSKRCFVVPRRELGVISSNTQYLVAASANVSFDKVGGTLTAVGAVVSSNTVVPFSPQPTPYAAKKRYANGKLRVESLNEVDLNSSYQGSLYFSGTTIFRVCLNNIPILRPKNDNFSLECWIYPTVLPTGGVTAGIVSAFYDTAETLVSATRGPFYWYIQNVAGTLQIAFTAVISTVEQTFAANFAFSINTWYHMVVSRNGTTIDLFINGAKITTGTLTGSGTLEASNARYFMIGGRTATSAITNSFTGNISNLRYVRGRTLYSAASYTTPNAPPENVYGTIMLLNTNYNAANTLVAFEDSAINSKLSFTGPDQSATALTSRATANTTHPPFNTGNYVKVTSNGNLSVTGSFNDKTYGGPAHSLLFTKSTGRFLFYNPKSLRAANGICNTAPTSLDQGYGQYPGQSTIEQVLFSDNNDILYNFTVECWVRLNTTGITQYILDFKNPMAPAANGLSWSGILDRLSPPSLYIGSDNKVVWNSSNILSLTSTNALSINTWYHLCYMRRYITSSADTNSYLFINGVLASGATATDSTYYGVRNPGAVFIGAAADLGDGLGTTNHFDGYISNLRISGGLIYSTTGFTPPTSTLSSSPTTVLLTCHAATICDSSPNEYQMLSTTPSGQNAAIFFSDGRSYGRGASGTGTVNLGSNVYPYGNSYTTFTWTCPADVSNVSILCIGGGGCGGQSRPAGGDSWFDNNTVVNGGGGNSDQNLAAGGGGTFVGDGGGRGGVAAASQSPGGGGAGGYSANGGTGQSYLGTAATAGAGGAGGGGGSSVAPAYNSAGGGGVGIYGTGSNGTAGARVTVGSSGSLISPGGGGSYSNVGYPYMGAGGGLDAPILLGSNTSTRGGGYGGGGGGGVTNGGGGGGGLGYKITYNVTPSTVYNVQVGYPGYVNTPSSAGNGGFGVVRLVWPATGAGARSYPSTNLLDILDPFPPSAISSTVVPF